MDKDRLLKRINALLDDRRAQLNPPTDGELAKDRGVTLKTIYMWRQGRHIAKCAWAFIDLAERETSNTDQAA